MAHTALSPRDVHDWLVSSASNIPMGSDKRRSGVSVKDIVKQIARAVVECGLSGAVFSALLNSMQLLEVIAPHLGPEAGLRQQQVAVIRKAWRADFPGSTREPPMMAAELMSNPSATRPPLARFSPATRASNLK
jgi:hypothetical protein